MNNTHSCTLSIVFFALLSASVAKSAPPPLLVDLPLKICGDGAEWPPYHFQQNGEYKGYDLEILHAILDPLDISFEFSMPPWKRCQLGTKVGDYQIAVSAAYSLERDQDYVITDAYYSMTPAVVTTAGFLADQTEVSLEELKQWRVCGIHGYHYSFVDVDTLNMVFRGPDYAQTIQKLGGKPCDVVLARREAVLGFNKNMGIQILGSQHRIPTIKGAKTDPFYLLLSREYRQVDQLKKILNQGIQSLKASGKLDGMLNKYL
jgi:polar amino acid transport system substrate-binding protein